MTACPQLEDSHGGKSMILGSLLCEGFSMGRYELRYDN